MSTLLRYILFMLALFTAKSIDEISVNTNRVTLLNSSNNNYNQNTENFIKNNNINLKPKLQHYNNEASYLLPLHPSMQQQLLLQQELEQNHKLNNDQLKNGLSIPLHSLTVANDVHDSILKTTKQHYNHNHGRYYQKQQQQNNLQNKNHSKNLPTTTIQATVAPHLPQPQRQTADKTESNTKQIKFHTPNSNSGSSIVGVNIPPFPALSGFNYFTGNKGSSGGISESHKSCGGILNARNGIIQTPKFPEKFHTPIVCVWVIDASEFANTANISIVVYLNQLYVLGGLKFTEYMYYSDDYKVPSHRVFELTEDDVTQVTWIQFQSQYLEIRFEMRSLDGTHLRALNKFLDVYGFNITYEVDEVKPYQCNALKCHFLGHCYAKKDFTSYYCSCFPGFGGNDCSKGPLCEQNYCDNGGTCKQIGDTAVTCLCPKGFKGNKCELSEIDEVSTNVAR